MKNNIYSIKIFFCIFLVFFTNVVLSNELEFNASEIESFNNGDLLKGYGGVEISDGLGLIITGEEFEFNKLKSILNVLKKVTIKDASNKNLIRSNQIIFDKDRIKL